MTKTTPKLFVGPMSKNIVDACIEYANEKKNILGLIPSRRQIDANGGYVNGWNTQSFASYVKSATDLVILQRDHGGPDQGDHRDDGIESLKHDSIYFDLLHIDPFKKYKSLDEAASYTADIINDISESSRCHYEIGTEEAIFPMSVDDAHLFFSTVKNKTGKNFDNVDYLVVQFGTKIVGSNNTGSFDINKAKEMILMCKSFGKMAKEHNGDYLSTDGILSRKNLSLDALNIAPEMGSIESNCLLDEIYGNHTLINEFYQSCIDTNRWQKWFPSYFNPEKNKIDLLRACGHYCFSSASFQSLISKIDYERVVQNTKTNVKKRIDELL